MRQKAFPTALGVDGPLVYYTDPTCTGRPVQDTFAVARPSVIDTVWWKPDFKQFDPDEVRRPAPPGDRAPQRQAAPRLYATDVFCGSDPGFAEAVPVRRRVRDPRVLLQHHVPQERAQRRRPRQRPAGR